MKIIDIKQHPIHFFFKILLPIIVIMFIMYKSSEGYIIQSKITKNKSVIDTYQLSKNITTAELETIKNSGYIENDGSGAVFVLPFERYNTVKASIQDLISKGSEYSCVKYNSGTYSETLPAKDLLRKHFDEIKGLVGSSGFYSVDNNEFGLGTGKIVIAKSLQPKIINSLEYNKYFTGNLDNTKFPVYLYSEKPYPAGKGKFYGYTFDNYSYSVSKFSKMNSLDKNKTFDKNKDTKLIFAITKFKKQGNGLIINEYNEKALTELKTLMNKSDIKVNEISLENENLSIKRQTYNSDGYYKSLDEYLTRLKKGFNDKGIKYTITEYTNGVIIDTNSEYLGIIFDKDSKLENEYDDIKDKLSLNAESYQIDETYYFIDKKLFAIEKISKDTNTKDCAAIIQNSLLIK